MIQLCAAWKTQQILNLAQKGELPGHSLASNIIANYSFANIPSEGVIIYPGKGQQISYLEVSYHTITHDIKSYIVTTFKDHHDRLKWVGFKWLGIFLVLLVFSIIMLIVVPIFGAILFILLIFSPFFLICYQRKLYEEYNQVLLPGITNYIQNTLLPKYGNGNNICAYLLYPATWNTSISDCNCGCGPNLQWMTVRFTLGNIQQPYGAPIYWSSTQNNTQINVNVQPQQYTQQQYVPQTYGVPNGSPQPQETTPMVQNITPYSQQQPHSQPLQQNMGPSAALPNGWRMGKTKEGRAYYINDVTKTTQWQHPGFNV